MLYQSNRKFKIWAYTVSHRSLLLRSSMAFPDEENYSNETSFNIDIELWDVTYIDIPTVLNNIIIHEIEKDLFPEYLDTRLYEFDRKVFEIHVENNKYYIIAGGILIGNNKWENLDRIFNYDLNLEHDNIIV